MDYSFTGEIVHNGERLRFVRPGRPLRAPGDDVFWNPDGQSIRYQYLLPGPGPGPRPRSKRDRAAAAAYAAAADAIRRLLPPVRACDASQTECAVCLQDYAADDMLRAMPVCAHAFHLHCISQWLRRKAVCPICRREVPLPTQQEQVDEQQQEQEEEQQQEQEEDEHGARRRWNGITVPLSAQHARNWD